MDLTGYKRQWAEKAQSIISRLKSLGRVLSSLRVGYQLGTVISEKSLRLCLVRRWFHKSRVIDVAAYALDPDHTGTWNSQIEAAAGIISGYLKKRRLEKTPVNIGLLGEDIAFRRMYLPPMPKKELVSAIRWEGEKLFPFEFNQCSVDYRVIGRERRGDGDQLAINIVAVQKSIVESIYNRFQAAKLRIGHVGFLPDFMASLLADNISSEPDRHDLILYLNEEQSMAVFVQNGILEFFQQFVTRPVVRPENDKIPANLDSLIAELNSFIDLYNGQSFGNTVNAIHLGGKYGGDKDAMKIISDSTGLPCRPIAGYDSRPTRLGKPDSEQIENYLDVIVAGLVAPDEHPLAPEAIKSIEERRKLTARLAAATGLAIITAGSLQLQLYHQEFHKKADLEARRNMVQAFEKSPGYQGYINLIGKLDRGQAYLNKARSRYKTHFHSLMKELTLLIPDNINLTTIDFEEEDGQYILRLDGHVRLSGFSPEIVLAGFVETLGKSPFFENVSVFNHNKKREQEKFNLAFQLKMDARV